MSSICFAMFLETLENAFAALQKQEIAIEILFTPLLNAQNDSLPCKSKEIDQQGLPFTRGLKNKIEFVSMRLEIKSS